jgi:Zn finger protein HypA/HybF involved in hydrogenase expression
MHEHSYVNHLVQRIDLFMRENAASRITGITVRLGAMSLFSPEHLQEHLARAMQDRLSEGADIRIVIDGDPETSDTSEAVIEAIDFEYEAEDDLDVFALQNETELQIQEAEFTEEFIDIAATADLAQEAAPREGDEEPKAESEISTKNLSSESVPT